MAVHRLRRADHEASCGIATASSGSVLADGEVQPRAVELHSPLSAIPNAWFAIYMPKWAGTIY